jgi:hypothetical protein
MKEPGARRGEERQAVGRRVQGVEIGADGLGVLVEALPLGPLVGGNPFGQGGADERVKLIAALVTGLQIQVEADDRIRAGVERRAGRTAVR